MESTIISLAAPVTAERASTKRSAGQGGHTDGNDEPARVLKMRGQNATRVRRVSPLGLHLSVVDLARDWHGRSQR